MTVQAVHLSCFSIRIFILHVLCSCLTSAYRCPRIDMTPVMVRWAQRRSGPGKWLLRKYDIRLCSDHSRNLSLFNQGLGAISSAWPYYFYLFFSTVNT